MKIGLQVLWLGGVLWLLAGSVNYSENGNSTYLAGEEFYADIIGNTELVAIDMGEEEDVIRLIGLLGE